MHVFDNYLEFNDIVIVVYEVKKFVYYMFLERRVFFNEVHELVNLIFNVYYEIFFILIEELIKFNQC
jgi:hypothetical protein